MFKRLSTKAKIIICLLISIFLLSLFAFNLALKTYVGTNKEEETILTVTHEDTIKSTLKKLEDENVINNANTAYYYIRLLRRDANFLAGTFEIPAGLDLDQVIDFLGDMDNLNYDTVNVRIIEGERCKSFAKKISDVTSVSYEDLVDYWDDDEVYKELQKDYSFLGDEALAENVKHNLEGYMFPDTYNFYVYTTKEDVTRKILDRTLDVYNAHKEEFDASEFSIHEIFTLASLVQYESGYTKDMPTIAGIFINRLNDTTGQTPTLGSSVTVCYILEQSRDYVEWKSCEESSNLAIDDPYNTYIYKGLMPGPIDNPGESAIVSVLNYEKTPYFYFVGDGDGNTYYATTYEEHLRNAQKYIN